MNSPPVNREVRLRGLQGHLRVESADGGAEAASFSAQRAPVDTFASFRRAPVDTLARSAPVDTLY